MPLHPQAERFLKSLHALNLPAIELTSVEVTRELLLAGISKPPADSPPLARVEDRLIEGPGGPLRIRIYTPLETPLRGCGLYFHGGGWVLNSIETHDEVVRRLAAGSGCVWISADYRLAPEFPYPAPLDDCYAVLKWAAAHAEELGFDPQKIVVSGDSAGGNLAAALCLLTRDQGGPAIQFQALIYPITDCDFTRPSFRENAEGYFLTTSQMVWFWDQYCPDVARRREPYASPLLGDLRGLPSALIMTAEYDPLRDEGEAYAAALNHAGVPTTLIPFPGLIHAFVRRVETFDAAREALAIISTAVRKALS